MSMAALDALAQRTVVRANVHGLRLARSKLSLFKPPTVEALYQASSALPRKANSLTHHSFFAAIIAKAKTVTTEHVQAALQEVA